MDIKEIGRNENLLENSEDLKWFLHNAIRSSKNGKYNKRAWDLLQVAIDAFKIKLIMQNEIK